MPMARKPLPKSPAPQQVTRGRLFDNIAVLDLPEDFHWQGGVTWEPYPCRGLSTDPVDPCDDDALDTDADEDQDPQCETWIEQAAFRLWDSLRFLATEVGNQDDAYDYLLDDRMRLIASAAFAYELVSGSASGAHSLSSVATAPDGAAFGAAAAPIWSTLSVLGDEYAERTQGARGIFHIPPGLLVQAKPYLVLEDGEWRDVHGHKVVSDAGYTNMTNPVAADPAGDAEDWVYISGEVRYRWSMPADVAEAAWQTFNIERNWWRRFVDSIGLLVFDHCPVSAMLTSYDQDG